MLSRLGHGLAVLITLFLIAGNAYYATTSARAGLATVALIHAIIAIALTILFLTCLED